MAFGRALLLRHPWLALALVTFALATKAVLPAGFMLAPVKGGVAVILCSGQGPEMAAMPNSMPMPMPGAMAKGGDPRQQHPTDGKSADHPCAFSSLAMAAATGADATLLALALAYALASGVLPVVLRRWRAPARLRPPLRAPPLGA